MDDIYGDLENYNDVNVVEELKNENKDLKLKLEEYEKAMEKLQKDFDKLSSEFKNLEMNYSSLLRTARAEIERKTLAIAALNREKDMLVLSSIQNSHGGSILKRNFLHNRKSRKDDVDSVKTNKKEIQETKKSEPDRVRNDENRQPLTEDLSSGDEIKKVVKIETKSKIDESKDQNSKPKRALSLKQRRKSMPSLNKEHPKFSSDEESNGQCSTEEISKREWLPKEEKSRKRYERHKQSHKISETSGIDEKYSSYHESSRETYFQSKPYRQTDVFRTRDKSRHRRHFSPEKVRRAPKGYNEDHRQEFSRYRVLVSPPRDSYEPVRSLHKKLSYERDSSHEGKHMNRDNYHEDRKKREDYRDDRRMVKVDQCEDRNLQRNDYRIERKIGNYQEERRSRGNSREDLNIQRSDSHEDRQRQNRIERKIGNYQEKRRSRDNSREDLNRQRSDSHEDRQRQKSYLQEQRQRISSTSQEINRQRDKSYEDRFRIRDNSLEGRHKRPYERFTKMKASSDFEEPSNKRARLDSASTPTDELSTWPEEQPTAEERLPPEFGEHLQQHTCQSPDNIHFDAVNIQPKEIMTTASTCVEDPRLTSKRYVKGMERDKVVITTTIGRNIDLIAIDRSTWDSEAKIPEALQKLPEEIPKNVQDLHIDLENPISNMSIESGEIHSESNDVKMAEYVTQNFFRDYENERMNLLDARNEKQVISKERKRDSRLGTDGIVEIGLDCMPKNAITEVPSNKEESSSHERKLPPVKYKIPHTAKNFVPHPLEILLKQCKSSSDVEITTKPTHAKLSVDETFGSDNDSPIKTKDVKEKPKEVRQLRARRKMSATEIVEKDLELSDETSDTVLTRRQKKCDTIFSKRQREKEKNKLAASSNKNKNSDVMETVKSLSINIENSKNSKPENKTSSQDTAEATELQTLNEMTEAQSNVNSNKKTKKKSGPKLKAPSTIVSKNGVDGAEIPQKKTRLKKSKSPDKTKQEVTKPKFSDLFGDSSSLMTPEDLGMVTELHKKGTSKNYVPIFEDAQDSVDVNVSAGRVKGIQMPSEHPYTISLASKVNKTSSAEEQPSVICKINLPKTSPIAKEINSQSTSLPIKQITPNMEVSNLIVTKELAIAKEINSQSTSLPIKQITPNMEVSNLIVAKELDIVKTVIISTGTQPQVEDVELHCHDTEIRSEISDENAETKFYHVPPIPVALATSTPHKRLLLQLEAEVASGCNSTGTQNDITSSADQSSMSNGQSSETPNDDVPDVRIFVRRRKKIKK